MTVIQKETKFNGKKISLNNKLEGFKVKPKIKIKGELEVNSMLLINPTFIEKVLKKKIKNKLDYYLQYIISLIDDEETDPTGLRSALNDLTRYKSIIEYKYQKYLDEKYVTLLLKKIDILEHEIKSKIVYKQYEEYDIEETKGKSR